MLAALTGATGFMGSHLVGALQAQGFDVRVLARREPSPPGWTGPRPEVVAGDLSDVAALERLVEGAAVVVHCAAAIKAPDLAGFMAVNRDGTTRLAEAAARRAPGAHVLVGSSLAARAPEVSSYAASKRAGESAAAAVIPSERLTIVRPPAIYGPGDRETLTLFQAAALSPVLPLLSGSARMSLMHVADAAAHTAALAARRSGGTWTLADERPEGYGWREILLGLGAAVGRRPLLVPVSPGVLTLAAGAGDALSRVTGRPPLLSPDKVRELLQADWAVTRTEMADGLPAPKFNLEAGFASAAAWYRAAGWLA